MFWLAFRLRYAHVITTSSVFLQIYCIPLYASNYSDCDLHLIMSECILYMRKTEAAALLTCSFCYVGCVDKVLRGANVKLGRNYCNLVGNSEMCEFYLMQVKLESSRKSSTKSNSPYSLRLMWNGLPTPNTTEG